MMELDIVEGRRRKKHQECKQKGQKKPVSVLKRMES